MLPIRKNPVENGVLFLDVIVGGAGVALSACAINEAVSALVVSWTIIAESLYCLFRVRKNRLLLTVYAIIAYACYSICYANYINRINSILYTTQANMAEAHYAIALLLLFVSCLALFLPKRVRHYGYGSLAPNNVAGNELMVVALVVVLAIICVYGFGRPSSLGGERGSPSAIYEYSTVVFIAAFYLAGNRRGLKLLILALLAMFAFQNIAYGGRSTAIQLLIIAFFFVFNEKMHTRILIITAIVFLVAMIGYGAVRTSIWSEGIVGLAKGFVETLDLGMAWNTAYSSWHTSITFIRFEEIILPGQHQHYLNQWLLSIPLGGSAVEDSTLAVLTRPFFYHDFGGVLPIYVWFYFGIPGVVASGVLVAALSSATNRLDPLSVSNSRSALMSSCWLCTIYFVASSPRWFLYSPSQITRGLLLCLAFCAILIWIDRCMRQTSGVRFQKRSLDDLNAN